MNTKLEAYFRIVVGLPTTHRQGELTSSRKNKQREIAKGTILRDFLSLSKGGPGLDIAGRLKCHPCANKKKEAAHRRRGFGFEVWSSDKTGNILLKLHKREKRRKGENHNMETSHFLQEVRVNPKIREPGIDLVNILKSVCLQ